MNIKIRQGVAVSKYCTSLYLCFLVLVFPLYYQDNYINILEAKTSIFTIGTIIYFIAILMCFWFESVQSYEREQKRKHSHKKKTQLRAYSCRKNCKEEKSWTSLLLTLFILVLTVSSIVSGDLTDAWFGANTKLFGAKILLLCCGIYFFVSKGAVVTYWLKGCFLFGTGVVFILTILNRFQIDPLRMYSNLIFEQWPIYASTIGNVNILSSYVCIFLPLTIGLFLYGKNNAWRYVYGCVIILGVIAGICTNSDSFFLGFGAAIVVFLWYALSSQDKLLKFLKISILCGVAMLVLSACNCVSSFDVPWEPIQQFFVEDISWMLVLLGLGILYFTASQVEDSAIYQKIRWILFFIIGIVAVAFLVHQICIFDDSWGTNRGYVWSNSVALFSDLPWHQKLFGIGPGCFDEFFAEPNKIRLRPFVDPHSDYLFYLITTGFLGFITWHGGIVSTLMSSVKKEAIVPVAVLCAWLAQSLVNTSLVFTVPYLFVVLGLCQYINREKF